MFLENPTFSVLKISTAKQLLRLKSSEKKLRKEKQQKYHIATSLKF